MSGDFRFSDGDWAEIYALLMEAKKHGGLTQPVQENIARASIEHTIAQWRGFTPGNGATKVINEAVAALRTAEDAFEKIIELKILLSVPGDTSLQDIRDLRNRAEDLLRDNDSFSIEWLGRNRVTKNDYRDVLIEHLFRWWEFFGGRAKRSTSYATGEPTGPLVEFLIKIADPAGIDLTIHAAAKLIRIRANAIKQAFNAPSTDAAYGAWDASRAAKATGSTPVEKRRNPQK